MTGSTAVTEVARTSSNTMHFGRAPLSHRHNRWSLGYSHILHNIIRSPISFTYCTVNMSVRSLCFYFNWLTQTVILLHFKVRITFPITMFYAIHFRKRNHTEFKWFFFNIIRYWQFTEHCMCREPNTSQSATKLKKNNPVLLWSYSTLSKCVVFVALLNLTFCFTPY